MAKDITPEFPYHRPRRMRRSEAFRRLVRETHFSLDQLVMPYFVVEGRSVKEPVESMPGQFRFSADQILSELDDLAELGVRAILLFGIPGERDDKASEAYSKTGIVQKAVREIKKRFEDLLVITDVCLCAYMHHGHCGILNHRGQIDNDASLRLLAEVALSHAEAGADIVAPSDMMDGRIRAIRTLLDERGHEVMPILSYAAKFASAFYGPFREAAHSAPLADFPDDARASLPRDRKSYQMDLANRKEALREIAMDIREGADMVMIKPALAFLDVIHEAAAAYRFPLAAYNVSGEYAMIKAASERGMIDEQNAVLEIMTSLVRAGAQTVISYHAKQIAIWNREFKLQLQ